MRDLAALEKRLAAGMRPRHVRRARKAGALKIKPVTSRQQFLESVRRAKEYIAAGDIFQVVLSQRFDFEPEAAPFNIYRALRTVNPSPYLYFLRIDDTHILGSSPEMLVRVNGRRLEYRPIAGTRPRGANDAEDKRLEDELRQDEKERAEHVMLVDLGRNDVGRVSEYGSVKVRDLMYVERYTHVMHLVSAIEGCLRPELGALDALAACFPAGTLSGAPKVRAMQIIEELEPVRRGVYGGCGAVCRFRRQSRFLHRHSDHGDGKESRLGAGRSGDRRRFRSGPRARRVCQQSQGGAESCRDR